FSSRRRHTRFSRDWSSDVCSSDLISGYRRLFIFAHLKIKSEYMGRIFEVRKATMFARWDRMAKQFTRIGKDIAIAVKAGGPDPRSEERRVGKERRERGGPYSRSKD